MVPPIDYPANAVKKAILDKFFPGQADSVTLEAISEGKIIHLKHENRTADGTRDDILAAVRAATSYTNLWEILFISAQTR
jgi:hypothetical protein